MMFQAYCLDVTIKKLSICKTVAIHRPVDSKLSNSGTSMALRVHRQP